MNIIKERRHRIISTFAVLVIKRSAQRLEIVLSGILGRITVHRSSLLSACAATSTAASTAAASTTGSTTTATSSPATTTAAARLTRPS
jgi:hypothetical protein